MSRRGEEIHLCEAFQVQQGFSQFVSLIADRLEFTPTLRQPGARLALLCPKIAFHGQRKRSTEVGHRSLRIEAEDADERRMLTRQKEVIPRRLGNRFSLCKVFMFCLAHKECGP